MLAAVAALASCATPEEIQEYRRKFPSTHDFILDQTNELAPKVTARELDACRAVLARNNGTISYQWRTFEFIGPFAPSPGFLCWKQSENLLLRSTIAGSIAMVAPVRKTAGFQIRDVDLPFYCVLKYENGAFSIIDSGIGYTVSRPPSACFFQNDPLKLQ